MGADGLGHGNNPPERLLERAKRFRGYQGDKLWRIMSTQLGFLERVHGDNAERWGTRSEQLREQALMMFAETAELLEHTPWKKHKKDYGRSLTEREREAVLEEAVDILHFVLNVFLILGVEAEGVFGLYMAKNEINRERQNRGY